MAGATLGHRRATQDDSMEGIGTSPRMGEGRTTQDDSMDGIGRVESGTETEQLSRVESGTETEQLPRCRKRQA
jgi:hypothetical protein